MANHPSAERRNRQRVKRTARNRSAKRAVRSQLKAARAAVASTPQEALNAARTLEAAIDSAARKGIVHPKAAARTKSRLYKRLHAAAKPAA